ATTSRSTPRAIMATRSRRTDRKAVRHGPADRLTSSCLLMLIPVPLCWLLHPELADEHVVLPGELVVADPLRDEVDQLRSEERGPWRLRHDLLIGHPPLLVRSRLVGLAGDDRLLDQGLTGLVAEAGDVDGGVAARVERAAAQQHVDE